MKMFLVGMLVMWVAMNLIVWIADLIDDAHAMRKAVPLFYALSFVVGEAIPALIHTVPLLPLCARYGINPFYTRITTICVKLDTEEARAKWLSKLHGPDMVGHWEKIFADYPLN